MDRIFPCVRDQDWTEQGIIKFGMTKVHRLFIITLPVVQLFY
ncbi:hypothetical protein GCWU000342_01327 [Shuttleworthella satelles DSM 14600]|uniref:Uncharacterized protein n=1 Tax=Shuttleworthella satelles DSM 14600 TaxID=626523 RepID=C4GBM4_9FIRM|nr:hypothetical protein GCWU000342_01327 [Shuttleworthia satelles DSM 14600]